MAEQSTAIPLQKPTKCQSREYAMLWAGWELRLLDFSDGL